MLPHGAPQPADLLSEGLAVDLAALERGLQQFLADLEGLGSQLLSGGGGLGLMPWMGTVVLALAALEVARRQAQTGRAEAEATSFWAQLCWYRLVPAGPIQPGEVT
jgi:hypothetical protein